MKTLEEILQKYFGCAEVFNEYGEFTTEAERAYSKLTALLEELDALTGCATTAMVYELDQIYNENY